jgi:excisionase family DNA binding protein
MENAYTVKEIAEIIGCPDRTIRKRIEEKQLQTFQLKNNPRAPHLIPASALAEFLANYPKLPEVAKFKIEKARKFIAELRVPYNEKHEK